MKYIKKRTKIIIVIVAIILLSILCANIDYSRTKRGKPPILAIYVGKNKYTKADMWYGLGYTVAKCPEKSSDGSYKLYYLDNVSVCVYSYDSYEVPANPR